MAILAKPGPAERAARKKFLEAWIAKNPEHAPLLAKMEAGEITEEGLWDFAKQHTERAGRTKRIETWLTRNQEDSEVKRVGSTLLAQLEAGEIPEEQFWWLIGREEQS